jgi:hypothetical protein
MVVHNFDIGRVPVFPYKANPPLVINANAMLARPVSFEGMEPIASWGHQVRQIFGRVKH